MIETEVRVFSFVVEERMIRLTGKRSEMVQRTEVSGGK